MGRQRRLDKKRCPLIVICYEGTGETSEKTYFKNFKSRNLRIQFTTGGSTDPEGMLNDLKNYIQNADLINEDDCTIYIVIDTDLKEDRIKKIRQMIKQVEEFKNYNIQVITSAPTFEIWYLMHYKTSGLNYRSSNDAKKALIKETNGKYTESFNLYPLISKNQGMAYNCAKKLEESALKNGEDILKRNPHSEIYKIIDKIEEKNRM